MTPEAYLDRARGLLPALRERAARAEQLRRMPDETFADFQEAGLFRALQPKRYGGYELDPGVFYQAVSEVAAVCGSSGWILGVLGVHNWHLAILDPQAQEEVWGEDDSAQLSTSLAPTGTVERVKGGYRIKGRWSFSSGCDHCQWAVLGGVAPPAAPGEPPDARVFLLPRADYRIDDNWHVMGLAATGSKDIVVDDAFVPEYRTHSYRDAFALNHPGTAVNDAPLFRLPFGLVFTYGIVSPAIGAAQGALTAFCEQAARRVNVRDGSRAVEDPFMQYRLAEAAAEIDAARERMLANFAEMMTLARGGRRYRLRLAPAFAGIRARRSTAASMPSTGCSKRAVGTASFSTTRSSAPGAMCTRCERMPATIPSGPRLFSAAPSSACRPRTSAFDCRGIHA